MAFELTHPLDIEDEQKLRTILNIDDPGVPLPDHLLEQYDQVRRTARRINLGVTDELLVIIALLAGNPTPEAPISFLDTALEMSRDERVLGFFKGKFRWGRFQRVEGRDNKIVIILDEWPSEERKFKPTSVRRPTREELESIGEL